MSDSDATSDINDPDSDIYGADPLMEELLSDVDSEACVSGEAERGRDPDPDTMTATPSPPLLTTHC